MDTKFSVAIHILVMLSEGSKNLSSQELARSVNTNASYIRKVIGLLKQTGLISSSQGRKGYQLTQRPAEISLLAVYLAVQESTHVQLFYQHQSPNQACPIGRHIGGALSPVFQAVEGHLAQALEEKSLADVISQLYQ